MIPLVSRKRRLEEVKYHSFTWYHRRVVAIVVTVVMQVEG